ncbi:MAG: redoxin domain-containing protein [Proteobacteria bacterium]|uniref:redoxin domain-containing protein n=1 Tax=Rudaea sp. TaxID=2136325 RepID=UPI00321F8867|nr:redoxin domain-containing protein [Pseudomonadota bacterium]
MHTPLRPRPPRYLLPRTAALLLAIALLGTGAPIDARAETGQDFAAQAGNRLLGQMAPALKLTTIDGRNIDLAALRGHKAVYLKFWATWCVPCREQMPHFENAYRHAGDDLEVVAINIGFDDTLEQIREYRSKLGITMPIVRDDDGRLGELFRLRVTPQHVIIDRDGRIAYVGHLADARLDAALADARKGVAVAAAKPLAAEDAAAPVAQKAKTLDGGEIALADPARKRRTVLAFLSPWCETYLEKSRPQSSAQCKAVREQLVAHGKDARVRWIGIAAGLWASEQDLREYRDQHAIPVPFVLDRDGALFRRYGVRQMPVVIVLGADGRFLRKLDPDAPGAISLLDAAIAATP